MKALSIAISFLKIPRFFITTVFAPLLIGFLLIIVQSVGISVILNTSKTSTEKLTKAIEEDRESSIIRSVLYQSREPIAEIKVCRWKIKENNNQLNSLIEEIPPSDDCISDAFDVAIHTDTPQSFDAKDFIWLFNKASKKIHICRVCPAGIVIEVDKKNPQKFISKVKNPLAYGIVQLSKKGNKKNHDNALKIAKKQDKVKNLFGTILVSLPGTEKPINVDFMGNDSFLMLNIASLIVVTLWLFLKSHRKILDYLAKNGSLMPLVSSLGKRDFYLSIWILTVFRVFCFLLPSIPLNYNLLSYAVNEPNFNCSFSDKPILLLSWIFTLICSLGTITIIGSISELRQREKLSNVLYRYIPILLSFGSAISWFIAIVTGSSVLMALKHVLVILPVFGLGPILLGPSFDISMTQMLIHSLLSVILSSLIIRNNTKWFSANLDAI